MDYFVIGFVSTANALLCIAGFAMAVILAGVVAGVVLIICGMAFDWTTAVLARHWTRTGRVPRHRWEQILLEAFQNQQSMPDG